MFFFIFVCFCLERGAVKFLKTWTNLSLVSKRKGASLTKLCLLNGINWIFCQTAEILTEKSQRNYRKP